MMAPRAEEAEFGMLLKAMRLSGFDGEPTNAHRPPPTDDHTKKTEPSAFLNVGEHSGGDVPAVNV